MQLTAAQRQLIREARSEANRGKLKHGARGRRRIPGLPPDEDRCIAINGAFSKTAGQRCYYRKLEGRDYCGMHRAQDPTQDLTHQPVSQLGSAGIAHPSATEEVNDAERESYPEPRRALLHQERREVKDVQADEGRQRTPPVERSELKRSGSDLGASRPAGSGHDGEPQAASGVPAGHPGGAGVRQRQLQAPGSGEEHQRRESLTDGEAAGWFPVSMTNGRRITVVGTTIVIQP